MRKIYPFLAISTLFFVSLAQADRTVYMLPHCPRDVTNSNLRISIFASPDCPQCRRFEADFQNELKEGRIKFSVAVDDNEGNPTYVKMAVPLEYSAVGARSMVSKHKFMGSFSLNDKPEAMVFNYENRFLFLQKAYLGLILKTCPKIPLSKVHGLEKIRGVVSSLAINPN